MDFKQYANAVRLDEKNREYFIHFKCGRKSYHPNDIRYRYCAVCHTFPEDQRLQAMIGENMKQSGQNAVKKGFF